MAEAMERTRRTPAQLFALVFGIVYLGVGVVGFFVTGFDDFASDTFDEKLLIFALNPLHNLVHLGIGAAWIGASVNHLTAKQANLGIGIAYALVAILGFFDVLEWLAIEGPGSADNWLHLGTAILAIYFGSVGARGPASTITV
jgi:hypothetical protein